MWFRVNELLGIAAQQSLHQSVSDGRGYLYARTCRGACGDSTRYHRTAPTARGTFNVLSDAGPLYLTTASPFDPMLFLSFAVTPIVVDVEVLTRRREGGVTEIVADQPKIYLLDDLCGVLEAREQKELRCDSGRDPARFTRSSQSQSAEFGATHIRVASTM
jgi:hypothetical protein